MERKTRYKSNIEIPPPKVCAALRSIAKWKSEQIDEEEIFDRLEIGVLSYLQDSSLSQGQIEEIGKRFHDEIFDISKRVAKLAKEIYRGRWGTTLIKQSLILLFKDLDIIVLKMMIRDDIVITYNGY